jgi:hypothetical protein
MTGQILKALDMVIIFKENCSAKKVLIMRFRVSRLFVWNVKKFLCLAVIAAILVFPAGLLCAKKIPPDKVKITTPVYTPKLSDFNPQLGRYIYTVSWQGIPAGTVEMSLNRTGDDYKIIASARSAKAIDYIYKLRYRSQAVISAQSLMPRQSVATTSENSRQKKIEMEFFPNGEIQSVYTNHHGKRESLKFDPGNFTLDPFSTALLALSMDWKTGDKRQFDTYNGRNRYLIELTAVDRTEITINGKVRKAIVISPNITKLTEEETKKLRNARIYISEDNSREILKISSDLFFGTVETDMVAFIPAKSRAPGKNRDISPSTESLAPADAKEKSGTSEIYEKYGEVIP